MISQDLAQSQWQQWLQTFAIQLDSPLQAKRFYRAFRTKAQPVLLGCEDGKDYIVKGRQAGRQIVNDQIVARLGLVLGAPVGDPVLVEIAPELIEIEPKLEYIAPGVAHGTRYIPNCFDQFTLIATSEPANRSRLIRLALLYGWTCAKDHQFLFNTTPPRLIHSVDHGHFFPNGPNWSSQDLNSAPPSILDPYFADCQFTSHEIAEGRRVLEQITLAEIVRAVAHPPDQWGITVSERVAMVRYLDRQKQNLLSTLSASS